jgi:cytochrome c553
MNHRIVSNIIWSLMLLFVATALLFAAVIPPVRSPGVKVTVSPKPIPHGLGAGFATCRDCHQPEGGATPLPVTHRSVSFKTATCATCHPVPAKGSSGHRAD